MRVPRKNKGEKRTNRNKLRCEAKIAYPTKQAAIDSVEIIVLRTGLPRKYVDWYACKICGKYHITHSRGKRKERYKR